MLNDREITEIKVWSFVSAEIKGDIVKAKYKACHPKIAEGYITIEIPLTQFIHNEIRVDRELINDRLHSATMAMAMHYTPTLSIRTIMDSMCKFELSYNMKETQKEMTLEEIEKALGYKVKIVNR